MSVTQSIT